jgi:Putative peptidoglycan binding domain
VYCGYCCRYRQAPLQNADDCLHRQLLGWGVVRSALTCGSGPNAKGTGRGDCWRYAPSIRLVVGAEGVAVDVAQLGDLYRSALAVRDDAVRASLTTSIAQAAAASTALDATRPPHIGPEATTSGDHVRRAQLLLAARGHDVRVDGAFDDDTEAAVKAFQKSAGLAVTGMIDDPTWSAITGVPVSGSLADQARAAGQTVGEAVERLLGENAQGAVEAAAAESIAVEAAVAESLAAESLAAESLAAEPLAAEPLAAEALAAEALAAEPLAAEPLAAEALAAEPLAAEALAAEPLAAEPLAAEPLAAEPLAAEALAAEPLAAEPLTAAMNAFVAEHGSNE